MTRNFTTSDGATDLDDISKLKLSWVKTQDQLNKVEAENIQKAIHKHLVKKRNFLKTSINEDFFKRLHFSMFCNVWNWAGKWRTKQTNIGIPPHQIPLQIRELCDDIAYWHNANSSFSIFEQGAIFHHRLVRIHPFVNGNGRFARLMSDIYLLNLNVPLPKWPSDLHRVKNIYRKKYLSVLKKADEGDYLPLLKMMKELANQNN